MYLRTLGGLALEGSDLTRPKPLLLLTYLALEGPRERRFLAELFWRQARDPRQSLTVALSQLREAAPGAVTTGRHRVAAEVGTDVADLRRALRERRTDLALDLYRGPFLAGLDLELGIELEEWLYATRESLASAVRRELLGAAEAAAARDDLTGASARAEQAWELPGAPLIEPDELERLHRLLRAAESVRADEVEAEALELGVGDLPASPEAARAALREIAERSRRPRPTNLPARTTSFVGREDLVERIAAAVAEGEGRLITLAGPPGVGKTRLALEVARTLHGREVFRDGVFFVPLAGVNDPDRVPAKIAEALDLRGPGRRTELDALRSQLRGRHLLAVLDNFEHLLVAARTIADLLRSCPGLTVLATSRVPLRLTMEREVTVPPLAAAAEAAGDEGAEDLPPALALFAERARAVRPDFAVEGAARRAVEEVCRRLDGLPLAIELAAVRVKVFDAPALAERLDRRFELLGGGARDRPSRHRSLTAALDWSHDLLDDRERALFHRVAVFHGGFTATSARGLVERLGLAREGVQSGLSSLVDQSLLACDPAAEDEPRFSMLETLREYGLGRLEEAGRLDETLRAHAGEMLAFAERAAPHLPGSPEQRAWLERLRRADDDLRAALGWMERRGEAELGLRLTTAIWRFWAASGHLVQGAEQLERLLRLPAASPATASRAAALRALATVRHEVGDFAEAKPLLEESLGIWRELGDPRGTVDALGDLAWVELWLGHPNRARELSEEALRTHQELGDPRGRALALNNLGFLALFLGEPAAAADLFRRSLELRREIGDRRGEGFLLANLAWARVEGGDPALARRLAADAHEILRELGDEQLSAWALRMRGLAALESGDVDEARAHLRESRVRWRRVGNRSGLAGALVTSGRALCRAGALEESARRLDEAIAISRRCRTPWFLAHALLARAETARAAGDAELAQAHRREGEEILRDPRTVAVG